MASSNPLVYVDESDPRIVYSDGWALYPSTVAYGGTLHFAVDAGTTASLTFNGTRVGVYGCGGDTNQYGWPEESFVVDGKTYLIRTDPTATPNTQFFNVSFFTSPALDPGEHTLVVTNINGTAPNRLWLDWFWFDAVVDTTSASPSASGNAAPTSSSGIPTSSSNGTNGTSAPLNTAVATSSSPASSSGVTSSSSHSQNLGAIIGGAVGGAMALLILGVLGAFCFFKRRSARYQRGAREVSLIGSDSTISPFMRHEPRLVDQPSTYAQTTTAPYAQTTSTPAGSYLTNGDSASFMVPPGPIGTIATSRPSLDIRTMSHRESTFAPSAPSFVTQPPTPNMSDALPSSAALKSSYSPDHDTAAVSRPMVQNEMPLSPGESERAPPPYVG